MIKRRFYKLEHGDRDAPSESSSSSDSELEAEATEESEGEEGEEEGDEEEEGNDNEDEVKVREKNKSCSFSSGYESEDSSANDVNLDASVLTGLPTSDDDTGPRNDQQIGMEGHLSGAGNAESDDIQHNTVSKDADIPSDLADCAVKCKSVYKCRLCPRIVCLTEETLQAHLKSKRHARSEKLLKEGRLKLMLNDDGKIEGGTPQENQASAEKDASYSLNKKGRKRHRLSKRWLKKKKGGQTNFSRKDLDKRRRANGN